MTMVRFFIRPVYSWACPKCRKAVRVDALTMKTMARHPAGEGSCPNCGAPLAVWMDEDGVARVDIAHEPEPEQFTPTTDEEDSDDA